MVGLFLLGAVALAQLADRRPPPPVEDGLQPPMSFDCRIPVGTDLIDLTGRISRFYLRVPPGVGIMSVPTGGAYADHVVLDIAPSSLEGLAGRYDLDARFPENTDRMVMTLPIGTNGSGYVLTASPVRFGVGYQPFTNLLIERRGPAPEGEGGASSWRGTCTTTLPQRGNRNP